MTLSSVLKASISVLWIVRPGDEPESFLMFSIGALPTASIILARMPCGSGFPSLSSISLPHS